MQYLTIAAKILEMRIEVKPKRKRKEGAKSLAANRRTLDNLFDNLKKDWSSVGRFCEVAEGQFCEVGGEPSLECPFLQLLLIA